MALPPPSSIFNEPNLSYATKQWLFELYKQTVNLPTSLVSTGNIDGAWAQLDSTDISGSPATHEITWDESAYSSIRIDLDGVQPATNGQSLRMRVGHSDGGTLFDQTSDYDGVQLVWEGTPTYSGLANSNTIDIAASCSNASNQTISGYITIDAGKSADLGCFIVANIYYINNSSNMRVVETKAFLDDGNIADIDTYRLYFASGNFANTGTITTWGLAL